MSKSPHDCKDPFGMNSYPNNQFQKIKIVFDEGNEHWYLIIRNTQTSSFAQCIIKRCPWCGKVLPR